VTDRQVGCFEHLSDLAEHRTEVEAHTRHRTGSRGSRAHPLLGEHVATGDDGERTGRWCEACRLRECGGAGVDRLRCCGHGERSCDDQCQTGRHDWPNENASYSPRDVASAAVPMDAVGQRTGQPWAITAATARSAAASAPSMCPAASGAVSVDAQWRRPASEGCSNARCPYVV